jgi:putative DNA primase/helicase
MYFLGYSLTGDMSEQCYLNFLGSTGANGKTTLLSLVRSIWGDYCVEGPESVMLKLPHNDGRFDKSVLVGARLVVRGDIPEGSAVNVSNIKDITGGEPMVAERKYHDSFSFYPQCKIILSSNYRLRLPEQGGPMERLMPFLASFKDSPDRGMPQKLLSEAPAVLAILIEYAGRWYRKKALPLSDTITATSDEYIMDEDAVKQFIAEKCVRGEGESVPKADLYDAFVKWSKANKPPSAKSFKDKMLARGYTCKKENRNNPNRNLSCFFGLRLLREGEEKPPEQGELVIQDPALEQEIAPVCANAPEKGPVLLKPSICAYSEKFSKIPLQIGTLEHSQNSEDLPPRERDWENYIPDF